MYSEVIERPARMLPVFGMNDEGVFRFRFSLWRNNVKTGHASVFSAESCPGKCSDLDRYGWLAEECEVKRRGRTQREEKSILQQYYEARYEQQRPGWHNAHAATGAPSVDDVLQFVSTTSM